MPDEPDAPSPERIDALMGVVVRLHGAGLDDEGIARLRENVERLRKAANVLDGYHLENSDEPDASFAAIDRLDRL